MKHYSHLNRFLIVGLLLCYGLFALPSTTRASQSSVNTDLLVLAAPTFSPTTLIFPFQEGQEWKVSNGWNAHNTMTPVIVNGKPVDVRPWNRWAMDLVPVSGGCAGKPVLAAEGGVIDKADSGQGQIIIKHGGAWYTNYMHMSSLSVAKGQRVMQGQQIGVCGNVGISKGAHIHFQVLKCDCANGGVQVAIQGIDKLESEKGGLRSTALGGNRVSVPATSNAFDTGITIGPDQLAEIMYVSGVWTVNKNDLANTPMTNANGYPKRYFNWTTVPSAPLGSLVGSLDGRNWMGVSNSPFYVVAGHLFLAINDGWRGDNDGVITVRIRLGTWNYK